MLECHFQNVSLNYDFESIKKISRSMNFATQSLHWVRPGRNPKY